MDDHQPGLPLELDHVFVWVSVRAPEAEALEKLGLRRLPHMIRNVGLGTASVLFPFDGSYLELIWIEDEQKARPGMLLRSRWSQNGACPFGIGLRRRLGWSGELPFPTTARGAVSMRPGTAIEVANSNANPAEPWVFVIPEYMAARASHDLPPEGQELLTHSLGVRHLTAVKLTLRTAAPLPEMCSLLAASGIISVEAGPAPLLELVLDGAATGRTRDARPDLPVILAV